jgi:Tht1-like nuclear fusion protein
MGSAFGYFDDSIDILIQSRGIAPRIDAISPPPTDQLLTTISALQRKPTCYRTAASTLIHHCETLSSDIPDPDRILFAIKLTTCELDLIHQTPAICLIEASWKECVRTLATKDHWWTTFSGNLREVTNVCWIGRREVEKGRDSFGVLSNLDQLLELHTNLTSVQARLLEILRTQLNEAEAREMQQQTAQRHWNGFTSSLEKSLESISSNTTSLMKDLFLGLLKLQSFTRNTARFVSEELYSLDKDVYNIRGRLQQMQGEINTLEMAGVSKIDQLAEMNQHRLTMVFASLLQNKTRFKLP